MNGSRCGDQTARTANQDLDEYVPTLSAQAWMDGREAQIASMNGQFALLDKDWQPRAPSRRRSLMKCRRWRLKVYLARVATAPEQLARKPGDSPTPCTLTAMPVRTRERSFFDYFVKPVPDSMKRAFHQQ